MNNFCTVMLYSAIQAIHSMQWPLIIIISSVVFSSGRPSGPRGAEEMIAFPDIDYARKIVAIVHSIYNYYTYNSN